MQSEGNIIVQFIVLEDRKLNSKQLNIQLTISVSLYYNNPLAYKIPIGKYFFVKTYICV